MEENKKTIGRQIGICLNNFTTYMNILVPENIPFTQEEFRTFFDHNCHEILNLNETTIQSYLTSKPWPEKYDCNKLSEVIEITLEDIWEDKGYMTDLPPAITNSAKTLLKLAFIARKNDFLSIINILAPNFEIINKIDTTDEAFKKVIFDLMEYLSHPAIFKIRKYIDIFSNLDASDIELLNLLIKLPINEKTALSDKLEKLEFTYTVSCKTAFSKLSNQKLHQWIALGHCSHEDSIRKRRKSKNKLTNNDKKILIDKLENDFSLKRYLSREIVSDTESKDINKNIFLSRTCRFLKLISLLITEKDGDFLSKEEINLFIILKYCLPEAQQKEILNMKL